MTTEPSPEHSHESVLTDDEENIIAPKIFRKKMIIESDEECENINSDDIEEDLESGSGEESIGAEDEESSGSGESDEAENDSDDEEESDESDATSVISMDSEFSWNEFQYIDDNPNNSFIQDEEESLRERYNAAMKLLLSEQSEDGFDSLSILYEEPLVKKQLVMDFTTYDWEKAKSLHVKSCEPKMKMVTFGITRALARFAKNPTLFYLQALSFRPADKALWYEFGCASAKLHDWKTAEMAFKKCLSPNSDAGVKLAIVYYFSKDYHKCVPLLRDLLTESPRNIALLVLKNEISRISTFWKFFVELYFPSNSLFFPTPELPREVYDNVLKELQAFSFEQSPEVLYRSSYCIEPLPSEPIRLALDQSAETFGKFLCSYFDQSTKQQMPFQQNVHFAKERRHPSSRSLNTSQKEITPTVNNTLSVNDKKIEEDCAAILSYTLSIIEDVEAVVQKLVDDVAEGRIPKPVKSKKRPPRKKPTIVFDVRRSTRRAEEIPFEAIESPVIGTFQLPTSNSEPVSLRTFLDLPSGDSTFPPLEFPGAFGYPYDEMTYSIIPSFELETFNVYLTSLLNKQHIPMEELLRSFLSFISSNIPDGCQLTQQQRRLFLEVYIRWSDTFCQPFTQHCLNASTEDLEIHLCALELDVQGKLRADKAFEIYLGKLSGIVQNQSGTALKFKEIPKIEDNSDRAMRRRAITLLTETDPQMAARIKSYMDESRISTKALSKEINITNAINSFKFLNDYAVPVKTAHPKLKKPDKSMQATKEMPSFETLDNVASDIATFEHLKISETSSPAEANKKNVSESMIKFIKLWCDLSKIMQRIKKKAPQEASVEENMDHEMSPMNESDMLSLLDDCSAISPDHESSEILKDLRDIHNVASNQKNIEECLKEYTNSLEIFVNEFKFKKDVEEDSIKLIIEDSRKAVQAMKYMIDRNAENEDIEMDFEENEKLKEIIIRFYWSKISRLNDTENKDLKKAYLCTLLHLIDLDSPIYTQVLDSHGRNTVITAKTVVKALIDEFRNDKIQSILKLYEEDNHKEVISLFTTDFNWYSCNEKEIISNLRILLLSFEKVNDRKGPVEWICRLLDRVISGKFEEYRDQIYVNCLQQLENLCLEEMDSDVLKLLAKRLVVCAEYDRFKKNARLWKILYKVASILEGSYDVESRIEMYQSIETCKVLLPTKALCLLAEGHRILGEEHHCCLINEGELLLFFIDELYKNFYESRFEDHYYSKLVQRNIELQLIQCLKCLFDSSVGKSVVYDHESPANLIPTVTIARKVQPFLIPKLPMFDDEKFTTNDVIDALTRVFPFIENEKIAGFDEAWAEFEIFIKNPPFFKFQISNNELQPVGDITEVSSWRSVEITDENREKLELFIYFRYVLLVIRYKKQSYTWDENIQLAQLAKECLVLSGPRERNLLPSKVIHSLWAICAYTHTMYFCYLEDDELAKQSTSYFYMFKMAFLSYPKAFQLHIDIAIAYYQINSRIQRHKRGLPAKKLSDEIELLLAREEMIEQCQLHFNQFRYRISQTDEYPKDISWIEPYFSGKIAEHKCRPLSEVFEHYHRCAMLMRAESYTYPLRVNKTTQENVEPLELHYRVHVYAMKQIFAIDKITSLEKRIENLRIIHYFLRLFMGHFIFAKKNQQQPLPAIETKLPFVDSHPPWDFEETPEIIDEGEEYYDDDVEDLISLMMNYTDMKVECIEYCRRAFETIVKRFPHYKSYYQLSLLHLIDNEFKQGLDIIFGKIFKGKFTSFENITEIERTDIERSETSAYHTKKLIRLTIALLKKCRDIPKTILVLEDLAKENNERLKLKPDERNAFLISCVDIFNESATKVIRNKNMDNIATFIKHMDKASSILRNKGKIDIDDKIKAILNRCRNAAMNIRDAREKQRKAALVEQERLKLQPLLEVQKLIAAKQKHDLAEKIKQMADEQAKKKKEEEEKKAIAEKTSKQQQQIGSAQSLLAYQKILNAKRAEEAAKTAKENEIMGLITARFSKIINNPSLTTPVKNRVRDHYPALMAALKASVEKGEALSTLFEQIDQFEKKLKTSDNLQAPMPPSKTSQTPAMTSSNISASSTIQKNQSFTPQPSTSSASNVLSKPALVIQNERASSRPTPPSKSFKSHLTSASKQQQQPRPKPQSNKTVSNTVMQKPSTSQPPQLIPSTSPRQATGASSSKPSQIDNNRSKEQIYSDMMKLLQQYEPAKMKDFENLKTMLLQKTPQELQHLYSTMFVQFVCAISKSSSEAGSSNTTSTTSNASMKRPGISPNSNVASKVRRMDNQSGAASSSSSTSKSGQQFNYLTEQVKKSIPKPIPSSSNDDDIMIIGETKRPVASNSNPSRSNPPLPKPAVAKPPPQFPNLTPAVQQQITQLLANANASQQQELFLALLRNNAANQKR